MIRSEGNYSGHTTDAILALHRRTLYRTVGTENAAVPRLWTKHGLAVSALVKKLTGVSWHRFTLGKAATGHTSTDSRASSLIDQFQCEQLTDTRIRCRFGQCVGAGLIRSNVTATVFFSKSTLAIVTPATFPAPS